VVGIIQPGSGAFSNYLVRQYQRRPLLTYKSDGNLRDYDREWWQPEATLLVSITTRTLFLTQN